MGGLKEGSHFMMHTLVSSGNIAVQSGVPVGSCLSLAVNGDASQRTPFDGDYLGIIRLLDDR